MSLTHADHRSFPLLSSITTTIERHLAADTDLEKTLLKDA